MEGIHSSTSAGSQTTGNGPRATASTVEIVHAALQPSCRYIFVCLRPSSMYIFVFLRHSSMYIFVCLPPASFLHRVPAAYSPRSGVL